MQGEKNVDLGEVPDPMMSPLALTASIADHTARLLKRAEFPGVPQKRVLIARPFSNRCSGQCQRSAKQRFPLLRHSVVLSLVV